jgi:hypothetical protein
LPFLVFSIPRLPPKEKKKKNTHTTPSPFISNKKGNFIELEGMWEIIESLEGCPSLKHLDLSCNTVLLLEMLFIESHLVLPSVNPIGMDGFELLLIWLKGFTSLEILGLSRLSAHSFFFISHFVC